MSKSNEFANKVNNSNHVSTSAHDTGKGYTYLTADNIEMLKRIFPDEVTYIEHVETLWVLRELAEKACEIPNRKGLEYDINSPYFRIVKLTNDLIGALLQNDIHFGFRSNEVYHWKK
jgi:hypothetical protein